MSTYQVAIKEVQLNWYEVEANSPEEAKIMAKDHQEEPLTLEFVEELEVAHILEIDVLGNIVRKPKRS